MDVSPSPIKLARLRGEFVVLDQDLARFYEVKTGRLNEVASRNPNRFTELYSFQVTEKEELLALRSQIAIAKGRRRSPLRVYTERGVVMMAASLRSERANEAMHYVVSVFIEAQRASRTAPVGRNAPVLIDDAAAQHKALTAGGSAGGLLQSVFGKMMERLAEDGAADEIAQEAGSVLRSVIDQMKARLDKPGLENEKTVAEIARILAEVESEKTVAAKGKAEAELEQLRVLERKLGLMIALDQYMRSGSAGEFAALLARFRSA